MGVLPGILLMLNNKCKLFIIVFKVAHLIAF